MRFLPLQAFHPFPEFRHISQLVQYLPFRNLRAGADPFQGFHRAPEAASAGRGKENDLYAREVVMFLPSSTHLNLTYRYPAEKQITKKSQIGSGCFFPRIFFVTPAAERFLPYVLY
jgi:hypothetical protein